MKKTYTELNKLGTLRERYEYCKLSGGIGEETFGNERYINQEFYTSDEWKKVRREVILRDDGCELGLKDFPINGRIYIHHLNPVSMDDIIGRTSALTDPDNLVCVSHNMHNAIHYGSEEMVPRDYVERTPGDTVPWKKGANNGQEQNPVQFDVHEARTGKRVTVSLR